MFQNLSEIIDPDRLDEKAAAKFLSVIVSYLLSFAISQVLNWLCLLHLHKAKLNPAAQYLMSSQCMVNLLYTSLDTPSKLLILTGIPVPQPFSRLPGVIHLFCMFSSQALQEVMLINRLLYFCTPIRAQLLFRTKARALLPCFFPLIFGSLFAAPAFHACCYREYEPSMFSMEYRGYERPLQLRFSATSSAILVVSLLIGYSICWTHIWRVRNAVRCCRNVQNPSSKELQVSREVLPIAVGSTEIMYKYYY